MVDAIPVTTSIVPNPSPFSETAYRILSFPKVIPANNARPILIPELSVIVEINN